MFIRSERLFLRPAFPEDAPAILAGINDAALVRQLASAPWPYRMEDARRFAARPQDGAAPHFLVTLPGSPGAPVIGAAGLVRHAEALELGFWIARGWWGHGFATEAAHAVLEIAGMLGHRQLAAARFADNPASGRVLEKVGFAPTGQAMPRFSCARRQDAPALAYRWSATGNGQQGRAAFDSAAA
jgi:RimJ/RimL family protein N-acetyltransferase